MNTVKYQGRKIWRLFSNITNPAGYSLAVLCIKKVVYADMLINNSNSLHYINPNHTIYVYCDTLCFEYLTKRINKFTYKAKIVLTNEYKVADKPWQYYKIEVHIKAAWNDQIDTDADGIWHNDLVIDQNKITMLTFSHKIKEAENEVLLMEKVFEKKEWVEFHHRVAAFVSIPKKFMTKKIEDDLRYFNHTIFTHSLDFIEEKVERDALRRLSEELAVNLALQINIQQELITVLKESDEYGKADGLQSLYYGCINNVTE
jgi:hypothetical protein